MVGCGVPDRLGGRCSIVLLEHSIAQPSNDTKHTEDNGNVSNS